MIKMFFKELLFSLPFFFLLSHGTAGESCTGDRDCHRPNTYCYISGECVDCLNCRVYQRQNGSKCSHDRNHCGDCLPGMSAEENIDGTMSVCTPIKLKETDESEGDKEIKNNEVSMKMYIFPILFFVILLAGLICCLYRKKYRSWIQNILIQLPFHSHPPPYSEKYTMQPATAPPYEGYTQTADLPVISERSYSVEDEATQKAVISQNPCYVRGGHLTQNNDPPPANEQSEETDSHPLINDNAPIIVEEETQPSTWTPENGSDTSIQRRDFSNIISGLRSQLTISTPVNAGDEQAAIRPAVASSHSGSDISINIPPTNDRQRTENSPSGSTMNININNMLYVHVNRGGSRNDCHETDNSRGNPR